MAQVKQESKILRKPEKEGKQKKRAGALRWIAGWIMIPALVIGGIFGTGLHLGANHPEAWYTRAVLWMVELFA